MGTQLKGYLADRYHRASQTISIVEYVLYTGADRWYLYRLYTESDPFPSGHGDDFARQIPADARFANLSEPQSNM